MNSQILSLKFEYNQEEYFALLRTKEKEKHREYHVTIMCGELEKILYGSHIIIERNGKLQFDVTPPQTEEGKLRNQIMKALQHHLDSTRIMVQSTNTP